MTYRDFTPVMSNGRGANRSPFFCAGSLNRRQETSHWDELVVVTAMVGAEWPDSATDFETHILWHAHVRRCESTYPSSEEFFLVAPSRVETKAGYGVGKFDEKWEEMADLYCGHADLPLFASCGDAK